MYRILKFVVLIAVTFNIPKSNVNAVEISSNSNLIAELEKSSTSNQIEIIIQENPAEAELVSKFVCGSSCCYTVTDQYQIFGVVSLLSDGLGMGLGI